MVRPLLLIRWLSLLTAGYFASLVNAMSRRKSGQNSVEILGYGSVRLESNQFSKNDVTVSGRNTSMYFTSHGCGVTCTVSGVACPGCL
jgi:hypothetical protein